MARGGARNRSGPQPDPDSLRSAKAGRDLRQLEPYSGDAPAFPLPLVEELDNGREHEVWRWVWTTPQASAWIDEPWRWVTIAMWVRWTVRMEGAAASASMGNVVVRLADQIGMTPAGLKENGWSIARETDPAKLAPVTEMPTGRRARDRFKVADDDRGA